jgi:hypothetical protein
MNGTSLALTSQVCMMAILVLLVMKLTDNQHGMMFILSFMKIGYLVSVYNID